jgi:hypothetical protein
MELSNVCRAFLRKIKGQLVCFHKMVDGVFYTLLYCLLPDKTIGTYMNVLSTISNLATESGIQIL